MILYRIYTEDRNRGDVIDYVSKLFAGFTTYNGVGYWRGQAESCLIIEILGKEYDADSIDQIAEWIRVHNNQESVAVTRQVVTAYTIGESL